MQTLASWPPESHRHMNKLCRQIIQQLCLFRLKHVKSFTTSEEKRCSEGALWTLHLPQQVLGKSDGCKML